MVEPQIFRGKCIDKQKGHHFENNVLTDTKFYGAVKNKNRKNNHQDVQHLAAYLFNGNGTKHSISIVHPDQDEKKNSKFLNLKQSLAKISDHQSWVQKRVLQLFEIQTIWEKLIK